MAKRSAASELNHDNWNEEEPPEKAGTFSKAAPDVLQNRVIKSAKRRSLGTPESARAATNSPFANFGGFAASPKTVSSSNKNEPSTNSSFTKCSKASFTVEKPTETSTSMLSGTDKKSQDYCSKLKGLNESVSKWIKSHVDSNPFCILTPIFRDYEGYLNEIEAEEAKCQIIEGRKNDVLKGNDSSNQKMSPTQNSNSNFRGISSNKGNTGISAGQSPEKQQDKNQNEKSTDRTPQPSLFSSGKPLTFSFGTGASSVESKSAGFTFGSDKPFSFTNVNKPVKDATEESKASDDDSEEPPKVEFSPIVEEGAKYSKRCKVFVKKGSALQDRGIGTLYLKPVESSNKTQLIVRAETSLGNLLINTLVTKSMAAQRKGSNVVMMVCIPTPESEPPPVPVLLRVKTTADADELLEKLNEYMV